MFQVNSVNKEKKKRSVASKEVKEGESIRRTFKSVLETRRRVAMRIGWMESADSYMGS